MSAGELWRRIRFWTRREQERAELAEEMRLHREMRRARLSNEGIEAAAEIAARRFGNETLLKEQSMELWSWNWLDDLGRDLKQTMRMLAANKGFAAVAILTLGLGMGANTAIFSVTNAVLLRQLPVEKPEQLYRVKTTQMPRNASNTGDYSTSFSAAVFEHLRHDQPTLKALVAYVPLGFAKISLRTGSVPEEGTAQLVSGNFFGGLGAQVACGRPLGDDDEARHTATAVVSYGFASTHFGSACEGIGRTIYVRGAPLTIVGVAAPAFHGLLPIPTDVWIPFQTNPQLNAWGQAGKSFLAEDNWWCILMMARLQPALSREAAAAQLQPAFVRAAYEPLGGKPERGEQPVRISFEQAQGIPGGNGMQRPLVILQVMVGVLLVIACLNVATLLAVRNAARTREFSLRLALGGSKGRLLRQLFAESLVLVAAGTGFGLVLAIGLTKLLARWAELDLNPIPDERVMLFTLATAAGAALLFGLYPAARAWSASLMESIKNSASTAYRSPNRWQPANLATVVQLSLCVALLSATGLLVRTLTNLEGIRTGLRTDGLLVFGVAPQQDAGRFYRELLDRIRALPGVQSVTLSGNRTGSGWSNNTEALVDGKTPQNVGNDGLRWNNVGPDFAKTMGMKLIAGRDFDDRDNEKSAPVAIVNRTFVDRLMKGQSALGHSASFTSTKAFTVVGIVEDSKYTSLQEDPISMAWFPYNQLGALDEIGAMQVELHTSGKPEAMLPAIRKAMAQFAPDLALLEPRTQKAQFDRSIDQQALVAKLSVGFAVLAAILVAIGLYGTIAYGVKRRTAEMGIRLALGAKRGGVVWMVLRGGLTMCAIGIALGLPLIYVTNRYLASLLYGVKPGDLLSIMSAALGVLLIAVVASYVPARRAAAVDPTQALRYE